MESFRQRAFRIFLAVVLAPLWIPFVFTDRYQEPIELWLGRAFGAGTEIVGAIQGIWRAFVFLCHLIGWVLTVGLLFISATAFIYIASRELGYTITALSPYYPKIENIVKNPVSWATATTIVATTVAIGHAWNLELNRKKYMEDQREKWKKDYEEKRKADLEKIKSQYRYLG